MRRIPWNLLRSEKGSVAPTVALSLIALIGAGGLAFDYARLATMDTELQNAADHAALAGASQLDKKTNACARANAAIQTLVTNRTLLANDGGGMAVTIPSEATCDATGSVRFYQNSAKTQAATSDANAKFVEVQVNARQARYALTPIVGAIRSGAISAIAFAGMGSAICKVPPLMMCNPSPGTPFNPDAWRGKGLKLFMGGGNSWGAGAFGWLDVGAVNNGTPDQNIAVGMDNPNTNCVADANTQVDTGVSSSVLDALNTRFDMFQNGWGRNTCYPHASCNPAWNTTKDVVRNTAASATACGYLSNSEWYLPPTDDQYIASNTAGDDSNIVHMGYPMDVCHYPAGGSCGTANPRFGNGTWRADLYFKTNHPTLSDSTGSNWTTATGLSSTASRFDMYRWEQGVAGIGTPNGDQRPGVTNAGGTQYGSPICKPPGLPAGLTQPDRRVIAAAVVDNCSSITGGSTAVTVGAWAEVFLVQPSVQRGTGPSQVTSNNEIYVEIIGRANPTGSGTTAQIVTRDVPYLIE
jgi:Flp pilus assembly protein TadG